MWKLGRISEICRNLSWKEARAHYIRTLSELQEDYSISPTLALELDGAEAFLGGDEHHNVRIASDSKRVYKVTANDQFGVKAFFDPTDVNCEGRHFHATENDDPFFYLNRWKLLNQISEYQTRFEGILTPERENFLPRICMSQPYLEGKAPFQTAISQSLQKFNFYEVSQGAYFSPETEVLLTDTFPRNVRIHDGLPALFDSVASQPTGEVRDWLLLKISR